MGRHLLAGCACDLAAAGGGVNRQGADGGIGGGDGGSPWGQAAAAMRFRNWVVRIISRMRGWISVRQRVPLNTP